MPPKQEYTCKSCGKSGYDVTDYGRCVCQVYYCMNHINTSAQTCISCNRAGCKECVKRGGCRELHHPTCLCTCLPTPPVQQVGPISPARPAQFEDPPVHDDDETPSSKETRKRAWKADQRKRNAEQTARNNRRQQSQKDRAKKIERGIKK